MKIAQVCPRYYPDIGGVETHVQEISERLVKRGFKVEVVCTDPSGILCRHEIINGVTVTRFRSFAPGEAYYIAPQMYFYLKGQSYDLVHAHSYHALPALFAALAKNGRRMVFTPHYHRSGHTLIRDVLHKPYRLIGSGIFGKADKVICVSGHERRKVIEDFNMPEGKVIVIPNGLDLEEFKNTGYGGKDGSRITLLYVGRLEEYKGVQHIINALPLLRDSRLEIIGQGPYEPGLRKLAEKLLVTERINWYKQMTREELLRHYASADVFIMLSRHEAYGITVAEALASGTPCIVAAGSALDEFVDGKRCLGIEAPVTTDKLVGAIRQLRESHIKDDMKIEKLPIHDWNDVTDKLIEVYRSIK
ncbi:glycosyltransferase family 4 protein [Candidatus Methanoperedens nitratireducens]|uniref:N-acetylglucosaminyl-phosphatidylinositol biosynthetic protein Spt14 n=1 Tax=Candidatus Methanoperedens nitratireducens TaxID=1392998 RepID=A0A284VUX4_9EURY|nr:glycosyltransferase family 4 protein [Candidatus Methanoperedens nitroreducens]SNQ62997.1 N-acetylglucosaminyl-phosphatidylinositol biosynthetic protein Spt14 [Candidatus Methanoperedens nitroreducens]